MIDPDGEAGLKATLYGCIFTRASWGLAVHYGLDIVCVREGILPITG